MSDEELRALEREVTGAGTVEARLRLSLALERAGREVEAWEAMLSAARDPIGRERLARWPGWFGPGGSPGLTRWLDVPPIRSTPELRASWSDERRSHDPLIVAAGAFGLAVASSWTDRQEAWHGTTVVLDAGSLEVRFEVQDLLPCAARAGEWYDAEGQALDPFTGAIHEQGIRGDRLLGIGPSSLSVVVRRGWWGTQLVGVRGAATAWAAAIDASDPPLSLAFGAGLVVVIRLMDIEVLEEESGAARWRRASRGAMIDLAGIVGAEPASGIDLAGKVRWRRTGCTPALLGPGFMVAEHDASQGELWLHERSEGERRVRLSERSAGGIAGARDVVYWTSHEPGRAPSVHATSTEGRALWSVALPCELAICQLAVGPGRVWALGEDGSLHLLCEKRV